MTRPTLVQTPDTTLKFSISTSDMELTLTSLVDSRGNAVAMADFGTLGFCTLAPTTLLQEEIISFTGLTVNSDNSVTLTGVTRNLSPQPPYTTLGAGSQHGAGTVVSFSNNPQLYERILDYIDNVAIAGAPDASLTAKGLVEIATETEIDDDEATGSTGAPVAVTPDKLALSKYGTRLPSADEKAALEGTVGTPSASNKFVTDAATTAGGVVESQTTSTDTFNVGEANTTTNQNKLAQKFTATSEQYSGVILNKKADTGTFTGTVTVSLQADTAGNPSGVALATTTITNANWLKFAAADIDIIFNAVYTSAVIGDSYWIVIETSTSDTSNHPNFGGRASGGTGNVEYNNTTDGWVAFANSDLYYKNIEATIDIVVKTNQSGVIPAEMLGNTVTNGNISKNLADASTIQTVAHGLARIPKKIVFHSLGIVTVDTFISRGIYTPSGQRCIGVFMSEGGSTASTDTEISDTNNALRLVEGNSSRFQTGNISVDRTNFYITWTKTSTPTGTINIMWEAE
jgi:hypothetical protein